MLATSYEHKARFVEEAGSHHEFRKSEVRRYCVPVDGYQNSSIERMFGRVSHLIYSFIIKTPSKMEYCIVMVFATALAVWQLKAPFVSGLIAS